MEQAPHRPIGIGIAGMGYAGREHLRAFHDHPEARVTAVCDVDIEQARSRLAEFGVVCPVYDDYTRLLEDPAVSAVVIASPNRFHADQAIEAARAGKPILLEKPPVLTPEEFERLEAATSGARVACEVDMVLRWHPMCAAAAELVRGGQLGEVFSVEAELIIGELEPPEPAWSRTRSEGGDLHLTIACHAIDQVLRLIGSPPVSVYAASVGRSPEWEFDATSMILMRFANGGIGRVMSSVEAKLGYELNLRVLGTRGTIVNNTATLMTDGKWDRVEFSPDSPDPDSLPFGHTADLFLKTLVDPAQSSASLADVRPCFQVVFAATRSSAEGKPVLLEQAISAD